MNVYATAAPTVGHAIAGECVELAAPNPHKAKCCSLVLAQSDVDNTWIMIISHGLC